MKRFLNAQTFLLSYPNMNANVWGCFLSHKVLKKRARKCFLQLYIQLQYNRGFYFPICMICFLRSCPFIQINLSYYSSCLVLVWRLRPVLHYCIVIYFWSSGIRDCILFTLIWKRKISTYALGSVSYVTYFIIIYEQLQQNRRWLFRIAGYASLWHFQGQT